MNKAERKHTRKPPQRRAQSSHRRSIHRARLAVLRSVGRRDKGEQCARGSQNGDCTLPHVNSSSMTRIARGFPLMNGNAAMSSVAA